MSNSSLFQFGFEVTRTFFKHSMFYHVSVMTYLSLLPFHCLNYTVIILKTQVYLFMVTLDLKYEKYVDFVIFLQRV